MDQETEKYKDLLTAKTKNMRTNPQIVKNVKKIQDFKG